MSRTSSASSSSRKQHHLHSSVDSGGVCMSVVDVYDIAADIGKEFERLIDSHGPEHVTELMQKVISALEHLEQFAASSDAEKDTIECLQKTVTHLELEEAKKIEERQRNDLELQQIEEHYKQETRDLLATVKKLQDENRKLASSLAAAHEQSRDSAFSEDETYFEVDLVNRLQTVIEKQRGQIKKLDQKVLDYKTDSEEIKCHNDKLTGCTRDLRRKTRLLQGQLREVSDERAELTAKLNDSHRETTALARQLGSAAKECEDLSLAAEATEATVAAKGAQQDDPERPRFSLPELKDILQERNSLKARVSDLEDELAVFRPRPALSSSVNSPRHGYKVRMSGGPVTNCDCSYHSRNNRASVESDEAVDGGGRATVAKDATDGIEDSEEDEEDLPVQGPLPEEPEDGPWRRNESGIRKLFRRVFTPQATTGKMVTSASTPALCQSPRSSQESGEESGGRLRKSFSRFSFILSSVDDVDESLLIQRPINK